MYAVIRAGGKQYRVAPGDVIEIEKLPQESGENVQFDEVLAVSGTEGETGQAGGGVRDRPGGRSRTAATRCWSSTSSARSSTRSCRDIASRYTAVKITGISVDGQALKA